MLVAPASPPVQALADKTHVRMAAPRSTGRPRRPACDTGRQTRPRSGAPRPPRRTHGVYGDDTDQKPLQVLETLAAKVFDADVRLVLDRARRGEERPSARGSMTTMGLPGFTTQDASRNAGRMSAPGTWWREFKKTAPSKERSTNGSASAPAGWKAPSGAARRASASTLSFGSTPTTRAPRTDNKRKRAPVPQPTSRMRFPTIGANAATMTEMASSSGCTLPSLATPRERGSLAPYRRNGG